MIKQTTWKERKTFGDIAETKFIKTLEQYGYEICFHADSLNTSFKPYDIIAAKNNRTVTFEVKNDRTESPNLAIEHTYNGRPSGIYSTESDFYVVHADDRFYMANTVHILEYIDTYSPRSVQNRKNPTKTELYLIPKDIYEPLDPINPSTFFYIGANQ